MHHGTIIAVGKVVKLVMLSIYISRIVNYAKRPASNNSCIGLCKHINVVIPVGRQPYFTIAVILLLAGGGSIYAVTKTVLVFNIRGAISRL